jgi:hypothetical protein
LRGSNGEAGFPNTDPGSRSTLRASEFSSRNGCCGQGGDEAVPALASHCPPFLHNMGRNYPCSQRIPRPWIAEFIDCPCSLPCVSAHSGQKLSVSVGLQGRLEAKPARGSEMALRPRPPPSRALLGRHCLPSLPKMGRNYPRSRVSRGQACTIAGSNSGYHVF